ncbi:tRNA dihydrouridine synthase DusB [Prosthecobacter sp.]|uniref:tRNA dihydrouridine synthase DusB n=1 Tax=Prosthecobacter sp. TaxID=1965333 RepID=UPI001D90A9D3|nr:tRNA dihydrouridine synthase DusB [Prosthecobacter sp.]MCB1274937.1 tRNA dihydrouridine synthase DusB [Prosthecobacter sp.]
MLPWLNNDRFPLYLAPMAGVTDVIFRRLCKEQGADVMVTEFVSAEGILQRDDRTRHYTDFDDAQRPLGVQLFGSDGVRMGEAARKIIDWKQPDFIDINFGCPVNKVVAKNGGSSLLKDCPLLASVAREVAKAVPIPVTAKIRIGWDANHVNAIEVAKILEDCGMRAIAVHGRTRAQGYTGLADWEVIGQVADAVKIPVIGNGDIASGLDVEIRRAQTNVKGIMIGRAAMANPWVFKEAKHYLATGTHAAHAGVDERFQFMRRHCQLAIERNAHMGELPTMRAMRNRLMNYTKSIPGGKWLRQRFSQIGSMMELEDIFAAYLDHQASHIYDHPALDSSSLA